MRGKRRALALGSPVVVLANAHTSAGYAHLTAQQVVTHHNATLCHISCLEPQVQAMGGWAVQLPTNINSKE